MIRIVTVCGAGVGSSMMLRLFAQQILADEGVEAEVEASDVSSVDPNAYDIIVTTSDFADAMRTSKPIVRIDNMMDKAFLRQELVKTISRLGK